MVVVKSDTVPLRQRYEFSNKGREPTAHDPSSAVSFSGVKRGTMRWGNERI
jgi:hypothetical protein